MQDRPADDTIQPDSADEITESVEDFAALFEADQARRGAQVERDRKVEGTVVSIGQDWVFLDIGGKSEGMLPKEELLDKEGVLTVDTGDKITAYVVSHRAGETILSRKMTSAASDEAMRGASTSGVPVEGMVVGERKGGYTVRVFGKDAFCPFSQMELRPSGNTEQHINRRYAFRVTEYSQGGRNIVLSRRVLLEEEQAERLESLKKTVNPGDVIKGVVKKLADFGAFVDIGGIEGLIPISELAWRRVENPAEVLSLDQEVTVQVLEVDWGRPRISLSLRRTLEDPWTTAAERYPVGKSFSGTVKRLANFGAFVELEPGIEGLVHISQMGAGRRINHPKEVVNEGEQVEVNVLSLDPAARRMGLEINVIRSPEDQDAFNSLVPGARVLGTVESVKEYGVFLALPGGAQGLLHVSEIDDARRTDLRKRFPRGSQCEVEVLTLDPESGRISLSAKGLMRKDEEKQFQAFSSGPRSGSSFGTLGDILKDKLKG
jgi:small subunit ribosomal protein S1